MKQAIINNAILFATLCLAWMADSHSVTALVGIAMWLVLAALAIGITVVTVISFGLSKDHEDAPPLEERVLLAKTMCKNKPIIEIMVQTMAIVPVIAMMLKLGMNYQAYALAGIIMIGGPVAKILMTRNANKFLSQN